MGEEIFFIKGILFSVWSLLMVAIGAKITGKDTTND